MMELDFEGFRRKMETKSKKRKEVDSDDEDYRNNSDIAEDSEDEFDPEDLEIIKKPKSKSKSKSNTKLKQKTNKQKSKKPPKKKIKSSSGSSSTNSSSTNSMSLENEEEESRTFDSQSDFSSLTLKLDHITRPLWVCPNKHIFLESFSPLYPQAYDFLIAIAEPVCRPSLMHEYKITSYSLYAAVSVGLRTNDIIQTLDRLSKVKLPEEVEEFINEMTTSYGKLKLVLQKNNQYFLESIDQKLIKKVIKDNVISGTVQQSASTNTTDQAADDTGFELIQSKVSKPKNIIEIGESGVEETEQFEDTWSFQIQNSQVEVVKKRCIEINYPVLEEYDFRGDDFNPRLDICLKPQAKIRHYQEKSLNKMFGNGRARSGLIVLPCGAGKTLVGVTATCTIQKSTLVLCTSSVAVEQWRSQYKLWSTIQDKNIFRFISSSKEKNAFGSFAGNSFNDVYPKNEGLVVVTTYSMIAYTGKRSEQSQRIMKELRSREWGLLIMDEVHVVPAKMFRKVLYTTASAHCKLGLTATLVREDAGIEDLNFLIGPKLYEANWLDLEKEGFIAKVQCSEVWCPMTSDFYKSYLNAKEARVRKYLYVMNPNKVRACEWLIRYHEERNDKVIVFSENLYALEEYGKRMGKEWICGSTSQAERMRILGQFQFNTEMKTVFISNVGDNSIDLPEANVIIQISSSFGSRRQEAQRLGRILRPKPRDRGNARAGVVGGTEDFNAFFYSLVSKDTQEMYYSSKRQQFLVDQGYSFKVVATLPYHEEVLGLSTTEEQKELLDKVLKVARADVPDEKEEAEEEETTKKIEEGKSVVPMAKRVKSSTSTLSGGEGLRYLEFVGTQENSAQERGGFRTFNRPPVRYESLMDTLK